LRLKVSFSRVTWTRRAATCTKHKVTNKTHRTRRAKRNSKLRGGDITQFITSYCFNSQVSILFPSHQTQSHLPWFWPEAVGSAWYRRTMPSFTSVEPTTSRDNGLRVILVGTGGHGGWTFLLAPSHLNDHLHTRMWVLSSGSPTLNHCSESSQFPSNPFFFIFTLAAGTYCPLIHTQQLVTRRAQELRLNVYLLSSIDLWHHADGEHRVHVRPGVLM